MVRRLLPALIAMCLVVGAFYVMYDKPTRTSISNWWDGLGKTEVEANKEQLTSVRVETVHRGDLERLVSYSATIKGSNEATIYPKVAAKVMEIRLHEGDRVSKGETIMVLDTTDYATKLTAAQAAVTQANSTYYNVKKNLDRTRELYDQGAASEQQLETVEMQFDQASAAVDQAQSARQDARNLLNNCTITSPIDGFIGLIEITEGNMATSQLPVAVVSNTNTVKVVANVGESDIGRIKVNTPVTVKVDSLGDKVIPGVIDKVAMIADPITRRFPVEIKIDNPENLLKSGMFAEVTIPIEKRFNVVKVPKVALLEKGSKVSIYVVKYIGGDLKGKANAFEHPLKVGIEGKDYVEVLEGVEDGDDVIIKGQTFLHAEKESVKVTERSR
ncbi:MAG: efflux RND transporter periplasmic adaptor subunit [Candidatus Saccharibacteria bacterium]